MFLLKFGAIMRKTTAPNGYMTLKVELTSTGIVRTIVVPEHMTLTDLHDAIQSVMGWHDAHLWQFTDNRRDGVIYELPNNDGNFAPFSRRMTIYPSKIKLSNVFPKRGAKLFYEYDFGDSWDHVITRQADPKTPEIACVKTQGPDGIDDFGGQWSLANFIQKMRTDPDNDEYAEVREWWGLETADELKKYLDGRAIGDITAKLRARLAHIKPADKPVPDAPMTEEEMAHKLGLIFATLVDAKTWKILEEALRNGGSCEFEDPEMFIGEFFLTMFDGLKVKSGRNHMFHTEPSRLTVLPEWVEMYGKHGEEWRELHDQFDILEEYASSAACLYGVVSFDELHEIILHYDPGLSLSQDQVANVVRARADHCPNMAFRIENDMVVSDFIIPPDVDDIDEVIEQIQKGHSEFPRWYPPTRDELFDLWTPDSFTCSDESDEVERLFSNICGETQYDTGEAMFETYELLVQAARPEDVYDLLRERDILPKIGEKAKRELLEAIGKWFKTIHIPCLNGNTISDLQSQTAQRPKASKVGRNDPCPCGSGKKYKNCCGSLAGQ